MPVLSVGRLTAGRMLPDDRTPDPAGMLGGVSRRLGFFESRDS
jgi:hypothetical protein